LSVRLVIGLDAVQDDAGLAEAEGDGEVSDNSLRHREIACAIIIDTCGRFLLQQRDDIVGIIHPGKVGLFGGHREGQETFLECVVREVHEEISYFVPAERFEYLASIAGMDPETEGGVSVRGDFFVTRDIPVDALVITEGSLLIVEPDDVVALDERLTPTARFAMKAYGAAYF
jgi:8-oxo-dGTP diphosphatase